VERSLSQVKQGRNRYSKNPESGSGLLPKFNGEFPFPDYDKIIMKI